MSAPTSCELGPIRPPSEATSLLLRITRNCAWNKCAFCAVYKNTRFSKRGEEELIAEIDLLAEAAERVRNSEGFVDADGTPSLKAVGRIVHGGTASEEERRVALWLLRGGEHVFLQDADSLAIPPDRICRILAHLRDRFPTVTRITTYARSRTLAVRTPEQLEALRDAGLNRIHVGVETGCDELLKFMSKGCRAEHHITGLSRTVAAGIEVCCYVMPGLGGRRFTESHARETAAVLKQVNPQHIRLRTLWIDPGSPLDEMRERGTFELLEEDEIVTEIQAMIQGLRGATSRLVSDHDRNLLPEIEGHLTEDADRLDRICQRFLDLPGEQRDAFVLARRAGHVRTLDSFLSDPAMIQRFTEVAAELKAAGQGSLVQGMILKLGPRSI